ncbi:tyrosine-type recombinase/integrase [Gammaproteobacteria bacterium]|nr:tyrosine-type recombinase/integrase [Gammaproteobacteria bacterium]
MALTHIQIKQLQPKEADYWMSDERGLRLLVKKNGAMYWRWKYRFGGKQKTLALGVYPDVSLREARIRREKARLEVLDGIDPARERQIVKRQQQIDAGSRFSGLALEWWEHQKGTWLPSHAQRVLKRLQDNAFREMDLYVLDKVEPQDVIACIRKIESRDALDVASRVLQDIRRVFTYGVQTGRLSYNPATDLSGVLKQYKTQHRASLPTGQLGRFVVELRSYETHGRYLTKYALELLILTFLRPGEVRAAQWKEFDLKKRLWRIPAERMKMNSEHLVPLSAQAIAVLNDLRPVSGQYRLLFPSERNREKPMSDNTMRLAMFRMGYDGLSDGKARATPHGFRANATSILNENGFNADAVERQLSHTERNGVRAAYIHHAQFLEERTKMMQWWADYLDEAAESCQL